MAGEEWQQHESQTIQVREPGGKLRTYDVDEMLDIGINTERMRNALREQPQKFAYFATLYAAAIVQTERAEEHVKRVKVKLDQKVRKLAAESETKMTEAGIENFVKSQSEYVEAVDAHLNARAQEEALKAIRESLYQRHTALIALLNNARPEGDTDPGARLDRGLRGRR